MSVAAPTIDRTQVERLVREALTRVVGMGDSRPAAKGPAPKLVVNVSARHCHLTAEDVERLFGAGHKLKPMKYLYQEGEFAAEEAVTVRAVPQSSRSFRGWPFRSPHSYYLGLGILDPAGQYVTR